jgi:hypothetical protein
MEPLFFLPFFLIHVLSISYLSVNGYFSIDRNLRYGWQTLYPGLAHIGPRRRLPPTRMKIDPWPRAPVIPDIDVGWGPRKAKATM